ncbi:MAG: hypothetical protein WD627_03930, partial [Actinomycetota bacterium]
MIPSCSNSVPKCIGGIIDPGTFTPSATGTGDVGTACAGVVFTISVAGGEWTFNPPAPVVLQPPDVIPNNGLDTCRILYTFSVNKVPNHDASAAAGIQTRQVGFAAGDDTTGQSATGTGTDTTTVAQAQPGITTNLAQPPPTLGGTSTDTATLTPPAGTFPVAPTGTITFNLYGPNNATCTGTPHSSSTVPVNHFGPPPTNSLSSNPIIAVGTYRWVASYSGDSNYGAAGPTACGEVAETFVVGMPTPSISTTASTPPPGLGGTSTDSATLTAPPGLPGGAPAPSGTITFNLYGPNNATCTGTPHSTSTVPVTHFGAPVYTSAPSNTIVAAGTYRWVASYSGDSNYGAAGP